MVRRRTLLVSALLVSATAARIGLSYDGPMSVILFWCTHLLLPALVLLLIDRFVRLRRRAVAGFFSLVPGALGTALIFIPPFTLAVHCYDVLAAQHFAVSLIPRIEEFHEANQRYPLDVTELELDPGSLPFLIRNNLGFSRCGVPHGEESIKLFYCSDPQSNSFDFFFGLEDLEDCRPSYHYNSREKKWKCSGAGCLPGTFQREVYIGSEISKSP